MRKHLTLAALLIIIISVIIYNTRTSANFSYKDSADRIMHNKSVHGSSSSGQVNKQNINANLMNKLNLRANKKNDLTDYFPLELDYISMGYSERAAKILATKSPKQTISIEDTLDSEERIKMYNALKQRELLGYYEITKLQSDDIHNAESNIYDVSKEYRSLNFAPSIIPGILENEYNYLGYSYDYNFKFYPLGSKSNTLRRIFNNNKGTTIILDEESVINGETHSTEEFVTHRINGFPATIEKIKSAKDSRQAYHLIFGTDDYEYAVYLINKNMDLNQAATELLQIGEQLVNLNAKNDVIIQDQK